MKQPPMLSYPTLHTNTKHTIALADLFTSTVLGEISDISTSPDSKGKTQLFHLLGVAVGFSGLSTLTSTSLLSIVNNYLNRGVMTSRVCNFHDSYKITHTVHLLIILGFLKSFIFMANLSTYMWQKNGKNVF